MNRTSKSIYIPIRVIRGSLLALCLSLTLVAAGCSSSAKTDTSNSGQRDSQVDPKKESSTRLDSPPVDRGDGPRAEALPPPPPADSQSRGMGGQGSDNSGAGKSGNLGVNNADRSDGDRNARDDTASQGGRREASMMNPGNAKGNLVVVRKSWAKIRRNPSEKSSPLRLVYGNDSFQVVTQKDGWVQVRFGKKNKRMGWLAEKDVTE